MWRQIPWYPCFRNYEIRQVLVSVQLWFFYHLPSTGGWKRLPWLFYTIMKHSIHPVQVVIDDWTLDSLQVFMNYSSLYIINAITAVSVSTVTEWFKNFIVPYSSWTCHYAIRTDVIWCNIFPIIVTGEGRLNQANEHLATGILCLYLCNVDVLDLAPINRISSQRKLGWVVIDLYGRGSDA